MASFLMLYNYEIDALLLGVGRKLELVRSALEEEMLKSNELPLFPLPSLVAEDGKSVVQVSTIVESALVAWARDIKRAGDETPLEMPQLSAYVERYLFLRKIKGDRETKFHRNEMMISLSEAGLDAIRGIEKYLKSRVDEKLLYPAPKRELNRKMIIVLALQYANRPAA